MLRRLGILLLLLCAVPALACFGPKLYIGVEPGARGDLAFALVSLYVKEKTGVEAVRVELAAATAAAAIAQGETVDLALAPAGNAGGVLTFADGMTLIAGHRLRDDLQFTTVLPALSKLQGVIAGADLTPLQTRIARGEGALAVARSFFKEKKAL